MYFYKKVHSNSGNIKVTFCTIEEEIQFSSFT